MEPSLAILAGEVSGDLVGGALALALRSARPDVPLWGMGGPRMAAAGVDLLFDCGRWGAIGVVEALRVYPELRFRVYPRISAEIVRRRPSAVVLIDFGAFNVRVARDCRRQGIPVLYYFPPGSWKRRARLNPELARVADRIATPFPWSAERLAELGASVQFVGHPLLELARPSMTRAEFAERFGMEPGQPIIGLLPGSRGFEVKHNTPVLIGAAQRIRDEVPGAQFAFGAASARVRRQIEGLARAWSRRSEQGLRLRLDLAELKAELASEGRLVVRPRAHWKLVTPEGVVMTPEEFETRPEVLGRPQAPRRATDLPAFVIAEGLAQDVMAHADVLLVCSGTATLEAAVLGTPMVIMYRGSWLMGLEARLRRVRPEHIGMPNIVADERIVPEYLQEHATPEALAECTLRLLRDPAERARMRDALARVRASLGSPGASERTARLALSLAGLAPQQPYGGGEADRAEHKEASED